MNIPVKPANILLPRSNFDKWAVIACDQYTSDREYWKNVERITENHPSAYKIMLPEIYLEESDVEDRIKKINEQMKSYLDSSLLEEYVDAMIYVERAQRDGKIRQGIVAAVDLEAYDYSKNAKTLIRATEGTVLERIPPRVRIRKNAPLEMPHIMLLIDDKNMTAVEKVGNNKEEYKLLYDFDLMAGGGHIRGWLMPRQAQLLFGSALKNLIEGQKDPLLFAVGDGNHSLATAKECYNLIKQQIGEEAAKTHPARYALAEIVNIHSPALEFEPIYRVLFGVDPKDVIKEFKKHFAENGKTEVRYCYEEKSGVLNFKLPEGKITTGALQDFIDGFIKARPGARVDYIHGEEDVKKLVKEQGRVGFIFEGISKDTLFPSVMATGALPRKTFSMGEAYDKRYYLECRKIK